MVCRKRSCYDTRNCFIDSLASRLHILQFVTWPISIFQADTEKNLAVPHTRLHRVMTRQQGGQGPHGLLLTARPCPARAALARGSSRGTRPRGSRQGPGEAGGTPGKPAGPRGRRPGPGGRRPGRAGLRRPRAPRCSGPGAARGLWRPCFLVFCPSQRGRCGALFPQSHPFQKKIKIKNIPLTRRHRETPNVKPASLGPAASPPRETKTRSQ